MAVQLSETDKVRIATETAESFTDAYYTALCSSRSTVEEFYLATTTSASPGRTLPIICFNGEMTHDPKEFQTKYEQMPFTFFDVQSLDAHVLNPCIDANSATTQKEAERNLSISIQASGSVRLLERKDGPMKGFTDHLVVLPNKEADGKMGRGRQWVIQTQSFRFVT